MAAREIEVSRDQRGIGRFWCSVLVAAAGLTVGVPVVCCRGLGANPESLKWFAESERVHARWAMLAVAGILVQVRNSAA